MSNEVATTTDQFVPVLGSGFGDPLGAVTMYADIIDTAYNLAEKLCRTPLVGTVYRGKPADAAVAILYGAEIGLNPIQSLQQIFTVHGTPSIYARTMVALLKRRGYRFQTIESTETVATVTGTAPSGDIETCTWTIDRATKAGYVPRIDPKTGKYALNSNGKLDGNMKYLTDPANMLYAKAAAEVCRRLAPDVLLGISRTTEDLESEPAPAPVRVVSERVSAAELLGDDLAAANQPVTVVEWNADQAAEPVSPEPEPVVKEAPTGDAEAKRRTVRRMTKAQSEVIGEHLAALGVAEEADQLALASKILDREIKTVGALTYDEAETLAAELAAVRATDGGVE
ncbi:hypothetical protein [Nocardia concava]|uniref:hypothetical protein n=1 Tax=Nocardia concava TaxID=257281 RepID=UPI0002E664D4|nr:hypothetical protein [Nocardia concava]